MAKTEKEFQFDVNNVEISDLEGNNFKNILEKQSNSTLPKMIGNFMYTSTRDLGMFEKAQKIYKSLPVLFSESEKELFVEAIKQMGYPVFVQQGIISVIKEKGN